MDIIWYYTEIGKDNKYIELQIIKEYLISEVDTINKEINVESENAEKKNIPTHLINIFKSKLTERKEHLKNLLSKVQDEIKEYENRKN